MPERPPLSVIDGGGGDPEWVDPEPPKRRRVRSRSRHAPAGWEPMQAAWWPEIAEALPTPWPESAVLMDLRWWAGQAAVGGRGRPGRPTLRRRWGWSDRQVRNILRSEELWADPRRGGQQPDSNRTAATRENAENQPETDSNRTASVPTGVQTPITDHRSLLIEGEGGPGGGPSAVASLKADDPLPAAEPSWVDRAIPRLQKRIEGLGFEWDTAKDGPWLGRMYGAHVIEGPLDQETFGKAIGTMLSKLEAGRTTCKPTRRGWHAKAQTFWRKAAEWGSERDTRSTQAADAAALVLAVCDGQGAYAWDAIRNEWPDLDLQRQLVDVTDALGLDQRRLSSAVRDEEQGRGEYPRSALTGAMKRQPELARRLLTERRDR